MFEEKKRCRARIRPGFRGKTGWEGTSAILNRGCVLPWLATYIYVHIYKCVYVCTYVFIFPCICICIYIYICVCMYACPYVCVCIYLCMYIYTYAPMCVYEYRCVNLDNGTYVSRKNLNLVNGAYVW